MIKYGDMEEVECVECKAHTLIPSGTKSDDIVKKATTEKTETTHEHNWEKVTDEKSGDLRTGQSVRQEEV